MSLSTEVIDCSYQRTGSLVSVSDDSQWSSRLIPMSHTLGLCGFVVKVRLCVK